MSNEWVDCGCELVVLRVKSFFYEVEVIFEVYFAFVPWRVDRHAQ